MFSIYKMSVGTTAPFRYLPRKNDEVIEVGEALALDAGKLTKCAATAKPAYIAMGPADENGTVPCAEVQPHIEFMTTLSAAGAALNLGDKVTLHTDGLQVTATTTAGVATIKQIFSADAGGEIIVSF